ncbi:ABC transporter ATP-binding protein [Lawsonibacter faecis]|uniref:ABC transporter ATP-binding protein n=1 Tax=Lawsonibacter faecis TaxID=2763052 RepID=A0A8J6MBC5_9FIRM|nr:MULTISPECIES: ABC transporter ATP-binding protein [Oscillospiraceae]MTQ97801.1 ATP-binding cassette domain-containing protein [Pseudoflavonifractor sp. BIOML-A16]MTR04487.1 ATP-binding cassette domain-containing protein [Pseudoflavonifractor sp. BIOML-A15]MTR71830.1 ATP-binding cassette domain-containing protein [Pseudoflavonifractor sp. BIOML-A18]MTS62627.1 ATP-binding cassette domain-containing protein [Pseudoflavonifractor sp. BIOML-A5]MTS71779.1 ATP-binding cassette domain-containing pr
MKKQSDLSKLLDYAGSFKVLTIASWVLSAVSALLALAPFVCIWRIIQEVLAVQPQFEKAVDLAHNGWLAVGLAVGSMLVYIAALMCSHIAAFRVQANIRSTAMHHIVTLPMGFMDSIGSGKLRKIVDESSAATETYLAHQLPDMCGAYVTPLGLLALLLVFDWRLGLLSLIPVVIAFAIMASLTGKRMQDKMKEYQNALEQMSNEAVEYVRGIPVVKTFGQSVFSFKRFKAAIDNYETWVIAYTKDMRLPMVFYTAAINAVFAVLIAAGLVLSAGGVTDELLLNLLFYIIITPIISVTLTKIMFSSENKMIVADAMERIDGVLALKPLPEPAAPRHPKDNSIVLNGVSFRYPGGAENALDGVSLSIRPGEHIALVGPSGGGKTTLASVVARFWDAMEGTVSIGGVDVREIAKAERMETVSFVFQDAKLLKTSIFENVRMAKPTATRDEVEQALRFAQCGDILEGLPQGMDTVIGTDGVYLSGGEQQRIAIARVMLKNAPILILDEATAFADPDNETRVQAAFTALSKGKTVIMIAHRLSTVTDADRIFVVKDGKIDASGKHQELVEQGGLYARLWDEYSRSAAWKVGAGNA